MITITIDDLDKYDISDLEKIMKKSVDDCMAKLFTKSKPKPDDDDYFKFEEHRACWLKYLGNPEYFITELGDVYREKSMGYTRLTNFYVQGNWSVTLCSNNKAKRYTIAYLLAECFLENPDGRKYIGFKDGDNNNYSVGNLYWLEKKPNGHYLHNGIEMYDLSGNLLETFKSIKECADKYGYTAANICLNLRGKTKTAYGHKFKYKC